MAAPLIAVAAAPNTTMGAALLASAVSGVTLLPFIAVVAAGSYIVIKGLEIVDDKVDDVLVDRAHRRFGAELNKHEALNRYLARKGRLGTETVKTIVNIPAPAAQPIPQMAAQPMPQTAAAAS